MTYPPSTLKEWKLLFDQGDISNISKSTVTEEKPNGINRKTIRLALRTGSMSESTFEAINKYYKSKERKRSKLIKS